MHSLIPFIKGEISIPIKKLIKSSTEYEFDLSFILQDYIDFSFEESKAISLKGIIWQQLGKEAFKEWYNYYHSANNTINSVILALKMFKRLLNNAYGYIKKTEEEYEKKKPKPVKAIIPQKRDVISLIIV